MHGRMEDATDIAAMTFEDALKALEDIVHRLERGDVQLDQSIALYERGEALRLHCQTRLDAAQARIEKIVAGPDGTPSHTVPFDSDG
jgi:exodeoxyribonuclease VII small subunit